MIIINCKINYDHLVEQKSIFDILGIKSPNDISNGADNDMSNGANST